MSTWTSNEINKNLAQKINNNQEYRLNDYLQPEDLNNIVQTLLDLVEEDEVVDRCLMMVMNEALKNRIKSKDGLNVKLTNSGERLNYTEIVYDWRNLQLYLKVTPSDDTIANGNAYLKYEKIYNKDEKTITLKISETQALRDAPEMDNSIFKYTLDFYIDNQMTNLFTTLEGTVTYTYESDVAGGD